MLLLSSIVRLLIDQFVSNLISLSSSHLRWSRFHNLGNLCLWNSWSGKLLLVEFGFPGFGICNPAQRIQNRTSDWNSKSNFYCWTIRNPQGGIQNPRMSWVTVITKDDWVPMQNRPLPSSKNPHFQNEGKCTTFLVKMTLFTWEWKIVIILKADHSTSFCYRGPKDSEIAHCDEFSIFCLFQRHAYISWT